MSAYSGKQKPGAQAVRRERKRLQAEIRNAVSRPERRRSARRDYMSAGTVQAIMTTVDTVVVGADLDLVYEAGRP